MNFAANAHGIRLAVGVGLQNLHFLLRYFASPALKKCIECVKNPVAILTGELFYLWDLRLRFVVIQERVVRLSWLGLNLVKTAPSQVVVKNANFFVTGTC